MFRIQLRDSLLNLHCSPWGAPGHLPGPSWGWWGPYTGWSPPSPQMGHRMAPPACHAQHSLPALQGVWHFDFPYSQGMVICNVWKEEREDFAPLSVINTWRTCADFGAVGRQQQSLCHQHCSGSNVTSWCHVSAAPGEDPGALAPRGCPTSPSQSCQGLAKAVGPWGGDGQHQSPACSRAGCPERGTQWN